MAGGLNEKKSRLLLYCWIYRDKLNEDFGKVYKGDFDTRQNNYFSVRFRKYVSENILTSRYKDSIEEYGYFDKIYKKLSEEIQNALEQIDFLGDTTEHVIIRYSKRKHGEAMLAEIDPEIVFHSCNTFFKCGLPLFVSMICQSKASS